MTAAADNAGKNMRLAGTLDLKAAGPLHQDLKALRGADLVVDADEVRRLGGLCLQVLLAARAAWAEDGRTFEFAGPSPAFVETATLMGAADLLGVKNLQEPAQ
jgi:chemotaxis protein CheX